MEAGVERSCCDRLRERVVIADEVVLVHAEVGSHRGVREIQNLQRDVHPANPPPHLEGIDSLVEEMTEQLSPRALLLAGGVPDARLTGSVVPAGTASRVGAIDERMLVGPRSLETRHVDGMSLCAQCPYAPERLDGELAWADHVGGRRPV